MLEMDEYYCMGNEEDVKNYQRKLDFMDDELNKCYSSLNPIYQKCVYEVIGKLTNGKDNRGYNLSNLIKAYQNADPAVSQRKICGQLLFEDIGFKYPSAIEIDNIINSAKKKHVGRKDTITDTFIKTLCEFLLVDNQLLEQGIGKIYDINEEWFEKYMADNEWFKKYMGKYANIRRPKCNTYEERHKYEVEKKKYEEDFIKRKKRAEWNNFERLRLYEEYLKDSGELNPEESIFKERWGVMTYSGAYSMLKGNEANAVKTLIKHMYAIQLVDGRAPFDYIIDEE